jgi:regulatory protein YycI of two-component signal transduction system YycFG
VAVCFQRIVNGMTVDGPGGKIVVYLDHENNPTAINQTWRNLGTIQRKVDLRPPELAIDELKKIYSNGDGFLEVHTIRLGYFEVGPNEQQKYLQPAYVLLFKLISSNQRFVMNSVHVSRAAAQSIETITPPLPRPIRITPRE